LKPKDIFTDVSTFDTRVGVGLDLKPNHIGQAIEGSIPYIFGVGCVGFETKSHLLNKI